MVSGNGKVSSIQNRQNERYSEFFGSNYKGKKRGQASEPEGCTLQRTTILLYIDHWDIVFIVTQMKNPIAQVIFRDCILVIRNPHFGWILNVGIHDILFSVVKFCGFVILIFLKLIFEKKWRTTICCVRLLFSFLKIS